MLGELRGRDGRAVFAFWLAFVVLVVAYVVCRGIVKSSFGRSLVAIRDNETAAAVMGVNRTTTKMLVFGTSAAMVAAAGSVATLRTTFVGPEVATITLVGGITFMLIMVLGGAGTLWGPIVGGLVYVLIDSRARSAGEGNGGLFGDVLGFFQGNWFFGSPATLILAIALIVLMFVAPVRHRRAAQAARPPVHRDRPAPGRHPRPGARQVPRRRRSRPVSPI